VYADCHGAEALESLDEVLRSRAPSWIVQDSPHVSKDYFGASDEAPPSPEAYRKQALAMRSKGYTALKFDLDLPGTQGLDPYNLCLTNREIHGLVKLIGAAREAVGFDVDPAVELSLALQRKRRAQGRPRTRANAIALAGRPGASRQHGCASETEGSAKIVDSGLVAVARAKSSKSRPHASRKLVLKAASRRMRLPSQSPARLTSSATSSSDSPPTESS
jgi:hypothetical protein